MENQTTIPVGATLPEEAVKNLKATETDLAKLCDRLNRKYHIGPISRRK